MQWQHFFGFNGRINREQYWTALALFHGVALLIAGTWAAGFFAMTVDAAKDGGNASLGPVLVGFWGGLLLLAILSFVLQLLCMMPIVKRLHDLGQSGMWGLLLLLAPLPALAIGRALFDIGDPSLTQTFFIVLSIGAHIALGCLRGQDGPNRFDHFASTPRAA